MIKPSRFMLGGHLPSVSRQAGQFIKVQPSWAAVGGPKSTDLMILRTLESGKLTSEPWPLVSLWASSCYLASVYTSVKWD